LAVDDRGGRAGFPFTLLSAFHIKGVVDAIHRRPGHLLLFRGKSFRVVGGAVERTSEFSEGIFNRSPPTLVET
jgi:hypothetical protein